MTDARRYTGGTGIPRLRGVKNYLNHYFAMYACLARYRMRVKVASPAYTGFHHYLNN